MWDPVFLQVKIGRWFEARASGWAVAAVPVLVLLVVAAGLATLVLR